MLQDPAKEHVEVLHDRPGFCPECLERYVTARGGGKVQLVARDGKWVCPRSGKSLAQEFGPDTSVLAAGVGTFPVLPTLAVTLGGSWLISRLWRRWKSRGQRPGDEPHGG